ncbi:MAG: tyrosine--tRNA ligase [Clostridia bacterium]|nr:tyrosine--tRNA ligase [Clostridia bacterium]
MELHGMGLYEFLETRGLLYQTTSDEQLKKLLNGEPMTFYLGIDPTANSLHIGHLCSLRTFRYLQEAGHKGILLVGGATAQVGDPSGRQDMRTMLTKTSVEDNVNAVINFSKKFIKTDGENPAIIVSNNDWMKNYAYVDFLRDVGTYFSVNVMLAAEAYKKRLSNGGLTFLEMGYMPIQAHDFEHLNNEYGCVLQIGGSDQWGNMVAGVDLVRRKSGKNLNVMTTPLLLNAQGEKMGKTSGGALWVDEGKVGVYDFYQYFVNVDDRDVEKLLCWFSDFPIAQIKNLVQGDIRQAKRVMAFEVTKLVHGEEAAKLAQKTADEIFSGKGASENMNTFELGNGVLSAGINICELLTVAGLTKSKGEARRLIEQGGIFVDDQKVETHELVVKSNDAVVVRKGKKVHLRVV